MILKLPSAGNKPLQQYPHNHLQSLLDGFVDFSGVENCELTFKGLSLNSKKVLEEYLFLACVGVGNNPQHGIAYAGEAINQGASCIVWEPTEELGNIPVSCQVVDKKTQENKTIPLVQVEALHEKAGEIAARFYQHPSQALNVIGVTGTNGKTSTTHFIAQLLHAMKAEQCALIGTLGNGLYGQLEKSNYTTPDAVTLQSLIAGFRNVDATTLLMEVSSHALSQYRVNGVEFDTAVLTNLTRDHLDYHGDMKAYADEKLKLFHFPSLQRIIVNQDDDFSQTIIKSLSISGDAFHPEILTYSKSDHKADFYAQNVSLDQKGISFTLCINKGDEVLYSEVKSKLLGKFNIENLLASITVLSSQGYEINDIVANIETINTIPGRMEKISLPDLAKQGYEKQPLMVVDFAHTPDALEKVLKALRAHAKGDLICVFGCGGDRDKGKRPLMAGVAQQLADQIIVTSDNSRTEPVEQIIEEISAGFKHLENVQIEKDREAAIYKALNLAHSGDVVLVAGKGHEEYQEVQGQRLPFSDKQCIVSFLTAEVSH